MRGRVNWKSAFSEHGVTCLGLCQLLEYPRDRGRFSQKVVNVLAVREDREESMKTLIELPVDGAGSLPMTVGVEIEQAKDADGITDVSRRGKTIPRAARSLGDMLAVIRPVAESFLGSLVGMTNTPDEIGLEFGVSLSADANLVVATTATQANFKVSLTWRERTASAPDTVNGPACPGEKQ